jgi:hypothetical protein
MLRRQVLLQVSFGALHVDRSRLSPGRIIYFAAVGRERGIQGAKGRERHSEKAAATIQPVYS